MEISFIIISKNEGSWLGYTITNLLRKLPAIAEIIVVDDGSTDGSLSSVKGISPIIRIIEGGNLGVARARNLGALYAKGKNLIFLDAHMDFPDGWWKRLIELLYIPGIGAVQPCITDIKEKNAKGYGERFKGPDLTLEWLPKRKLSPYPVPILCGCCFAVKRNLFLTVGGLDGGMIGWGSEDCEFSLRLWRLGYQIWIVPEIEVAHRFRTSAPYRIDWQFVLYNRLRIAFAHFNGSRLNRIISALQGLPKFELAYRSIIASEIWNHKKWLDRNSVQDSDWFLKYSGRIF